MSAPEVSVIIPTYNYGRFIEEAVASALAQTYRPAEVIVVDDGSTDDTRARVERFGPDVHYVFQANAGAAAARNTGIQSSRGEYVAFLDADDAWLPHKLERQVAGLEAAPDASLAYTWWAFIDESGNPLPQVKTPSYQGDVLEHLLFGCFVTFSMIMVRRSCLDRVGLLDSALKIAEDWDLLLRLAAAGCRFACVPEVLVRNRLHASHLSGDITRKHQDERAVLARALSRIPAGPRAESLRSDAFRAFLVASAAERLEAGGRREAADLLAEAAALQPQILERPGLYLGLALKMVPYGHRSTEAMAAQMEPTTAALTALLQGLFESPDLPAPVAQRRRRAWSSLMLALAVLHWRATRSVRSFLYLGRAFTAHPLAPVAAARGIVRRRLAKERMVEA